MYSYYLRNMLSLSANQISTLLSLYMRDTDVPLPTTKEVLLCNEKTTGEEVFLTF